MTMLRRLSLLLLTLAALTFSGAAFAAQLPANVQCQVYGYAPGTRDFAQCRMNVRRYWTTGLCGDYAFASTHPFYCHLVLPPFL
jgi:hypothetical protein